MAGMMTGLLLLLLVGVTVGRVVDLQKRIIGGKTCAATDRPYHVKLIQYDGTKYFKCGGTLIHKDWILTAGHCVPEGSTTRVTAFLGENQDPETNPVDIKLNTIERHKDNPDIVLLKLTVSSGLEPAGLPKCNPLPALGDEVEIAGHTRTTINSDGDKESHDSADLQCVKTNVVKCPAGTCSSGLNYDHIFCYKATEEDAWEGDSGGGVMAKKVIYGVHVSGFEKPCVRERATGVCEYMSWINKVINHV